MYDMLALRHDLGATWLNLLGSVGHGYGEHPIERMPGPGRLREFLAAERLLPAEPQITDEDARQARELREALRALLVAALAAAPAPEPAVATVNRHLAAEVPGHLTGGRLDPPPTVAASLALVARQAALHLHGAELAQIHQCPDTECRGAFLDPTGRRRWCRSTECGVKARVRAHRARQAAGPAE